MREVWAHEARDFTRWLLDNVDVLADVLEMELELTQAEYQVGGFALDLIGTDLTSGATVIVENQLEQSDHSHLGQLLTYAGGTDPMTIVWCAPSFRDEHRAAIDWLNERTDEKTRFFAVEVSAVRIDDSRPAPLFRLLAQPNDWSKQVHTEKSATLSGKQAAYLHFWGILLDRIRDEHPDWTRSTKPSKQSWMTLPYGSSTAWYSLDFTRRGLSVSLYFGSASADDNRIEYERVVEHREELEALFGDRLAFEPLEGKKACRINYVRPEGGDVLDADEHESYVDWFVESMDRFRSATQAVKARIAAEG